MESTFISSSGEDLDAIIEVKGMRLVVMDEFSDESTQSGDQFNLEISAFIDDPGSWETIFSSNPDQQKALVHIQGFVYQAYGQIISVSPVICDCGILTIESPFHTSDSRCIGEFVAFKVQRLDAWPA